MRKQEDHFESFLNKRQENLMVQLEKLSKPLIWKLKIGVFHFPNHF